MVLLWVVRMHSMGHVCRKNETTMDSLEVKFLVKWGQTAKDSLGDFDGHIAISTLCRRRSDLFVIEQHYHINLCVVALLKRDLRALDESIEGAE